METKVTIVDDHNYNTIELYDLNAIPRKDECIYISNGTVSIKGIVTNIIHSIEKYVNYNSKIIIDHHIIIHVW